MTQNTALLDSTRVSTRAAGCVLELTTSWSQPVGFDFHWLQETARGIFHGAAGLRFDAAARARASVSLRLPCESSIRSETRGRQHLVIRAAGPAAIAVRAELDPPDGHDELLNALLGIHPVQWLRAALKDIGSLDWKRTAHLHQADTRDLERLYDNWTGFTTSSEAAVWRALADPGALDRLRGWLDFAADPSTAPDDLDTALRREFEADPAFLATPAGAWLDAAAGLATAPAGETALLRLAAAARPVRRILEDDRLRALLLCIHQTATQLLNPREWNDWALRRARGILGPISNQGTLHHKLEPWRRLRDRLYHHAGAALERQLTLAFGTLTADHEPCVPLVEALFDATPRGEQLLSRVSGGDLDPLFEGHPEVELRRGALTHQLRRTRFVEIRMPFHDRNRLRKRAGLMTGVEPAVTGAGALFLAPPKVREHVPPQDAQWGAVILGTGIARGGGEPAADNSTPAFRYTLPAHAASNPDAWRHVLEAHGLPMPDGFASADRVTLTVTLPGRHMAAWADAPHAREAEYSTVFRRVAAALQRLTRVWIPALYFTSAARYKNLLHAYAITVFSCTPVFHGGARCDFTWDLMNQDSRERVLRAALRNLPARLEEHRNHLLALGRDGLATRFKPARAERVLSYVRERERLLMMLLILDAFLVEDMVRLGESVRDVRGLLQFDTTGISRRLHMEAPSFARAYNTRMRRIYEEEPEFFQLVPLFLVEATAALAGVAPRAHLTLEKDGYSTTWCSA